jgi:hypothetical protein
VAYDDENSERVDYFSFFFYLFFFFCEMDVEIETWKRWTINKVL